MKNLQIFALFLVLPLFFACQKEEPLRPNPFENYVTLTYSMNVIGDAELTEIRFMGQDNNWKTVANPSAFWQYEMDVEKGFLAKIEAIGTLPSGGQDVVTLKIKGENDHGRWARSTGYMGNGEFHVDLEFEITGE